MHKLDLSEKNTPSQKPVVDDALLLEDNDDLNTKSTASSRMPKPSAKIALTLSVVALIAGVATGFGTYQLSASSGSPLGGGSVEPIQQVAEEGSVSVGDVFGSTDKETFKDSAEGYLAEGGVDGEGSHQLLRPGGESQTVYLTSSVTDLDTLVGMEVRVWGETFKGQKAGWLMDVGRVEVLATDAEAPTEE